MAYARKSGADCPVGGDPWIKTIKVPLTTDETNIPVYVDYNNANLVHVRATVAAVTDGLVNEIDIEVGAAGGTEVATMTILSSSAVGAVFDATLSNEPARLGLSYTQTLMIEQSGASSVGTVSLDFIF